MTPRPDWRTIQRHPRFNLSLPVAAAASDAECPCGESVAAGDVIVHVQHLERGIDGTVRVVSDGWFGGCCEDGTRR